jgi:diguanylate cyclase (GGDEF)-like protein
MQPNSVQPMQWQHGSSLEALELLQQLTAALSVQHDIEALFKKMLEGALRFCGGTSAALYVGLPDGRLELRHGVGDLISPLGTIFAQGEGVSGWVYQQQQPALVADYQASQHRSPRYMGLNRSVMATPLFQAGQVIGVLTLIWEKQIGAYTPAHLELLTRFAGFASVALEQASLRAALEEQAKQTQIRFNKRDVLQKYLADAILRLEPFEALQALLERCATMIEARGAIALQRPGAARLELLVGGAAAAVVHLGNETYLRRALSGQPVLIQDYAQFPERIQSHASAGVQGLLAVALEGTHAPVGVLFFERYSSQAFSANDLELVWQVAPAITGLLENARLHLETKSAKTEAEQRAAFLDVLYQTFLELGQFQDLKTLAHGLLKRVCAVLGADAGGLYLRDGEFIRLIAARGDEFVSYAPLGYGVSGGVVELGKAMLLTDYASSRFHNPQDPGELWHSVISVPLYRQRQVFGALTLVDMRYTARFSPDDLAALEQFAGVASLALENLLLLETARQAEQHAKAQAKQLQLLHEASLTVARHAPQDVFLRSILERAANLLGADDGTVYMVQPEGKIVAVANLHPMGHVQTISPQHGISGLVLQTGLPQLVSDYQKWANKPEPEPEPLWQAALAVPLHLHGRVIGTLTLAHTQNPNQFHAADLATLERFASVVNVALENATLLEEATTSAAQSQSQTRLLEALYQTSLTLSEQLEPEVLLDYLVKRVTELFDADAGAVYLTQGEEFVRVAVFGDSPSAYGKLGKGLSGRVIASQSAMRLEDYSVWEGKHTLPDDLPIRWRSAMSAPLWRGEQVIGALTLADTRSLGKFAAHDLEALKRFAASASAALENTRLVGSLRVAEQTAQSRSAQMEALHEINLELGRYQDLELLLESILERGVMLLGAEAGRLDLIQEDSPTMRQAALFGLQGVSDYLIGEGAGGMVAKTGQSLLVSDYPNWQHRRSNSVKNWQSLVAVPLHQAGRVIGSLTITDSRLERSFSTADLTTLERLAASASLALERARLLDEAREAESNALTRARQLEALHQVSLEVSRNLEPEALLKSILERATTLMSANAGAVFLIEQQEVVLAAGIGVFFQTRVALGHGASGMVAQTGTALLIEDYQAWTHKVEHQDSSWRSVASVPLRQQQRIIGALTLADTTVAGRFAPHDLETLERFAGLASIALENARLYMRERSNLRDERVRARIAAEVAQLRGLADLAQAVLSVLEDVLGYQNISLFLLENNQLSLLGQIGAGVRHARLGLNQGVTGRVARTGRAEWVENGNNDPDFIFTTPELVCLVSVPLTSTEGVLGVLNLESSADQPLGLPDLEMLQSLASPIGTALHNALLHQQLERKAGEMEVLRFRAEHAARFDALTNLRNRRAFDEDLHHKLLEAQPFALAAIDLTGFKLVNDRFGHATGDRTLAQVAKVLSSAPLHRHRAIHRTYRIGGDEFMLIIPQEQPPLELLMHLGSTVENLELEGGLRIGLNIGLASYPSEAQTLDQLLSLADTRMYKAKSAGKPYLLGEELEQPPAPRRRSSDREPQG